MLNLNHLFLFAAVLFCTWLALRGKKAIQKLGLDRSSLKMFEKIYTAVVLFISTLLVLQIFGLDPIPVLTLSGVGAAVIGFASREIFANFFGGLMIYMTRPFSIGEEIELPGKKIAGTVEEIGWCVTAMRDGNKNLITIPNTLFSTEWIVNRSQRLRDSGGGSRRTGLKQFQEGHPAHSDEAGVHDPVERKT